MMGRRRGPPTADSIRASAERTYAHFSPESVLARIGVAQKSKYYYVYGILPQKRKPFFDGPMALDEADEIASMLVDGEVFEMDTKQLSVATQQIKAELIRRGKSPDEAVTRISHSRKEVK